MFPMTPIAAALALLFCASAAVASNSTGTTPRSLLAQAKERLAVSEEKSAEKIKALLQPVGDRLKSYEEQVQKLEKERVDAFGNLQGLIQSLREGQEQVRAEAARLGAILRQPDGSTGASVTLRAPAAGRV